MNLAKVRGIFTCLLLTLAATANAPVERFVEGVHYQRLADVPAAYELGATADGKSVLEVFWYGCGHCYAFDPLLNAWIADKGDSIAFARTPMIWDETTQQHARLFHTAQALGLQEQMHARIFDEIHRKRNFLLDTTSIGALFADFGVGQEEFTKAFGAFGVDTAVRKAEARQRALFIPSVPALIVNGSYLINTTPEVPTHQAMLDVAEFLLNKES
jgi:protein dithiol oxidoreductase (disulfide-forming)